MSRVEIDFFGAFAAGISRRVAAGEAGQRRRTWKVATTAWLGSASGAVRTGRISFS